MTYYHLLSVRDLLDFLLDALNLNNKFINYEYIIKTFIFFNDNFVERDLLFTFSGGKWSRQINEDATKTKAYEPAINLLLTN